MLPQKFVVNQVLQATIGISYVIIATIFILEMFTFYRERKKFSIRSLKTRWRLPLACASFVGLILVSLDGISEWVDWNTFPHGCDMVANSIALFFAVLKQCVNLFLYDRAKIVHEALELHGKWITLLRWGIWLNIAFGVHMYFGWSYFLAFFGRVSTDGDCIFITKYPEVLIAFAASDAFMNGCMLLMFAAPLYLQMRRSASLKTQATDKVRSVMRRNMIISLIVVSCDVFGLSLMSYFFITVDHQNPDEEFIILWGNTAAVLDQLIAIIGIHMMTAGWIPLMVRKRFRQCYLRTFHRVADFDSLTVVNDRS